jgi:hypothetical protein
MNTDQNLHNLMFFDDTQRIKDLIIVDRRDLDIHNRRHRRNWSRNLSLDHRRTHFQPGTQQNAS